MITNTINDIYYTHQFRFQKHHSTEYAPMELAKQVKYLMHSIMIYFH